MVGVPGWAAHRGPCGASVTRSHWAGAGSASHLTVLPPTPAIHDEALMPPPAPSGAKRKPITPAWRRSVRAAAVTYVRCRYTFAQQVSAAKAACSQHWVSALPAGCRAAGPQAWRGMPGQSYCLSCHRLHRCPLRSRKHDPSRPRKPVRAQPCHACRLAWPQACMRAARQSDAAPVCCADRRGARGGGSGGRALPD